MCMKSIQINNLIDHEFMDLYSKNYQISVLKNLESVKKQCIPKKPLQNRTKLIRQFQDRINKIRNQLRKAPLELDGLIQSTRNTEFNVIVTELLFSDSKSRKLIQERRVQTLENLKSNKGICQDTFNLLYLIYKNYYFGTESLSYQKINSVDGGKKLKTILISLKKMIVLKQQKTKKGKSDSTLPYYINLHTRNILERCEIEANSLTQKKLALRIKDILMEKKKWVGPRIWKIVKENHWDPYEIKLFINLIEKSYLKYNQLPSKVEFKQLKKQIKKILDNLKILSTQVCQIKSETEDEMDQMAQLYLRFEQLEKMSNLEFEYTYVDQIQEKMNIEKDWNFSGYIFEGQHQTIWM